MTIRLSTAAGAVIAILLSTSAAAQQISSAQAESNQRKVKHDPVVESIGGFSIVLVIGETQPSGTAAAETLPAGARKALNDIREFLPYKTYRVLDAQWTSCCAPRPTTTVSGRLQGVVGTPGPNGTVTLSSRPYLFSIAASVSGVNIPMRFVLALEEADSRPGAEHADRSRDLERERQNLQAEIASLGAQIRDVEQRIEVGVVPSSELRPVKDRYASLQRRLADVTADLESASHSGRAIIDSSFTMDAGETIVVGTSRLGGDKALIAIVTAVRKGAGSRE